jgi:hypothetical protein
MTVTIKDMTVVDLLQIIGMTICLGMFMYAFYVLSLRPFLVKIKVIGNSHDRMRIL